MFWNHNHRERCQSRHGERSDRFEHHANRGPRGRGGPWGRPGGPFGGGFGEWSGMFGGEPPRADRGAVRYLVLDALSEQPRHGYEVITVIEQRSNGSYRPSPGVVYPTLQMLEDMGHTRTVEHEGRKSYAITEEGTKELAANRDAVDDFYERAGENPLERFAEDFGEIRQRLGGLMKSFKRSLRRGELSGSTLTKVKAVIDDAISKIETIFAGDDKKEK